MTLPSLSSILLGKQYIGIEHFTLNNEEKIALLLVENKKEGLIISQKDRVSYTDTIADKWDKKLPFFLIVNTSQVIQKEVLSTDTSDEKLLHKAFPNTNWDDFYFEIWRLKTKSVIAISRKLYVDELLSHYKNQKITVAGISLGICSVGEIIGYTDQNQLSTNHQTISKIEENSIISSSSEKESISYTINELQIENRQLLVFSGILRLITNATANTGSVIAYSQELQDHYNQGSFFTKVLKIGIGVVLIILVFNFLFFTHYYKLAQETSETLLVNQSSLEDINKIKQRIIIKEEKFKSSAGNKASQSSLLINEIANKVPSTILLAELIYNPLEKKIKQEESIIVTENIITVKGITLSNNDLTQWIETIEKINGFKAVVITHFGKNEANETEFSIKITLK
jgi:Tfp pilus assembly protein PilN